MTGSSHFDETGAARMVDVSAKPVSERTAVAAVRVMMAAETLAAVAGGRVGKGDVLGVARLAGIMAAKRTADLIPLCHPLPLTAVDVELTCDGERSAVDITARCRVSARTGVEMEALTAAAVAALTVYDMCKSMDRGMHISELRLLHKAGGASGTFSAD